MSSIFSLYHVIRAIKYILYIGIYILDYVRRFNILLLIITLKSGFTALQHGKLASAYNPIKVPVGVEHSVDLSDVHP